MYWNTPICIDLTQSPCGVSPTNIHWHQRLYHWIDNCSLFSSVAFRSHRSKHWNSQKLCQQVGLPWQSPLTDRWCKTSRSAVVLLAECSAGELHRSLTFTGSLPVHRFQRLQLTLKKEKKKKQELIFCPKMSAISRSILGTQNRPYGEMVSNVNLIKSGHFPPFKNTKFDTRAGNSLCISLLSFTVIYGQICFYILKTAYF